MADALRSDLRRRGHHFRSHVQHHRLEQQLHRAADRRGRDARVGRHHGRAHPVVAAEAHSRNRLRHRTAAVAARARLRALRRHRFFGGGDSARSQGDRGKSAVRQRAAASAAGRRLHRGRARVVRSRRDQFGDAVLSARPVPDPRARRCVCHPGAGRACLCRRPPEPAAARGVPCLGAGAQRAGDVAGW